MPDKTEIDSAISALNDLRRRLGDQAPEVLTSMQGIASQYLAMGDIDKALEYQSLVVDGGRSRHASDSVEALDALYRLSRLHMRNGDLVAARHILERVVPIIGDSVGYANVMSIQCMRALASTLYDMHDYESCYTWIAKVTKYSEEIFGDGDRKTLEYRLHEADVLRHLEKLDEARILDKEVMQQAEDQELDVPFRIQTIRNFLEDLGLIGDVQGQTELILQMVDLARQLPKEDPIRLKMPTFLKEARRIRLVTEIGRANMKRIRKAIQSL